MRWKYWYIMGFVFVLVSEIFLFSSRYYITKQAEGIEDTSGILSLIEFPPGVGEMILYLILGFIIGAIIGVIVDVIMIYAVKKGQ